MQSEVTCTFKLCFPAKNFSAESAGGLEQAIPTAHVALPVQRLPGKQRRQCNSLESTLQDAGIYRLHPSPYGCPSADPRAEGSFPLGWCQPGPFGCHWPPHCAGLVSRRVQGCGRLLAAALQGQGCPAGALWALGALH